MLAFKIAMKANEQHDDTDADECGAQRLADVPKMSCCRVIVTRYARVEAEELRDGYAYAGEG